MKLLVVIIACFVGGSSATSDAVCGPLMEFQQCGTACPPTCDPPKPFCIQPCVSGCFCRRGRVLHNGRCIRPDKCPRTCKSPKVYMSCGSACPATCDRIPLVCPAVCVPGCFCPRNKVSHQGRCIDAEDCPKCSAPKIYKRCGSACPPTCNPNPGPCTLQCVAGCFCPDDKVLHKGRCISRNECPRRCKAPKVYKRCGSACPPTCNPNPGPCTLQCVVGCFCPDGTVLHKGRCIHRRKCPKVTRNPCRRNRCYKPGTNRCRRVTDIRYRCQCKPGWKGRFCRTSLCRHGRCP